MKKSLLAAAILLVTGSALGDNLLRVYERAVANDAQHPRAARANARRRAGAEPLARSQLLPNLSAGGTANANRFDRKAIDFQDTIHQHARRA